MKGREYIHGNRKNKKSQEGALGEMGTGFDGRRQSVCYRIVPRGKNGPYIKNH